MKSPIDSSNIPSIYTQNLLLMVLNHQLHSRPPTSIHSRLRPPTTTHQQPIFIASFPPGPPNLLFLSHIHDDLPRSQGARLLNFRQTYHNSPPLFGEESSRLRIEDQVLTIMFHIHICFALLYLLLLLPFKALHERMNEQMNGYEKKQPPT